MNSIPKSDILELTKTVGALEIFLDKINELRALYIEKKKEWEEKKKKLLFLPDTPDNRFLFGMYRDLFNLDCEKLEEQEKKWQRLKFINSPPPFKKGDITEEMKEVARGVSFTTLILSPAKRVSDSKDVYFCPFHNESTPSFTVFKTSNHYHCFGCQVHGDTIDFVMKTQTLSFKRSVLYLLALDKSL